MENMMTPRQQTPLTRTDAMMESREMAEIKAQIFLARQFPRDLDAVQQRILIECRNPKLAQVAQYEYPKGDTVIKGPSIRLMETIARSYGNCDASFIEVERRPTGATVKTRFWDFETNFQESKIFDVSFVRNTKRGSYPVTDEREKYEMMANYASRRLRACILSGIPSSIVSAAVEECERTLEQETKGQDPEQAIEKMFAAFRALAEWITDDMILQYAAKEKREHLTAQDIVKLRKLYTAIKDGFVKPESVFKSEEENAPAVSEQTLRQLDQINDAFASILKEGQTNAANA